MAWTGKAHPVEMLAEAGAPAALALAVGWSAHLAAFSLAECLAGAALGLGMGGLVMRVAGHVPMTAAGFDPAPFEAGGIDDELLLDHPIDELLLDDPLVKTAPDSRVVQLFAHQDPTPGELVLRISDFLSDTSRSTQAVPIEPHQPDASAALHAALANIRASLR